MTIDQSDYHISWQEFHQDTRELCQQLVDRNFDCIIAITRGGLFPAGILARELEIRKVETLCIKSYDHDQQGKIEILSSVEGTGKNCLLVDDLVDTGKTAEIARELLPDAYFVTIYAKDMGKPFVDQYVRDVNQNTWLHFPWDCDLSYSEPIKKR